MPEGKRLDTITSLLVDMSGEGVELVFRRHQSPFDDLSPCLHPFGLPRA
jgi:hypothetical protein